MVTFGEGISNGFKNYVNFTGRSTRAEYWFWVLFILLTLVVASILDATIFGVHTSTDAYGITHTTTGGIFTGLVYLGTLLPNIALSIRRLRDTAHHWAWIFISLIPLVGSIILIVFYCEASAPNGWGQPTSNKNPYGGGTTGAGGISYGPYPGR